MPLMFLSKIIVVSKFSKQRQILRIQIVKWWNIQVMPYWLINKSIFLSLWLKEML